MLTTGERDKFVAWLDAEIAKTEKSKFDAETQSDGLSAVRAELESIAFRMVALKIRTAITVQPHDAQRTPE